MYICISSIICFMHLHVYCHGQSCCELVWLLLYVMYTLCLLYNFSLAVARLCVTMVTLSYSEV